MEDYSHVRARLDKILNDQLQRIERMKNQDDV